MYLQLESRMLIKFFNKTFISTIVVTILNGCTTTTALPQSNTVSSFYDYQLYTPEGQPIQLQEWKQKTQQADVILIGEWHTHTGIHRFQTDILTLLSQSNSPIALSMEQFSRDAQPIINEYLQGDIGEQTLISKGNAWPNYESDYRPLIEYSKQAQMDVIAANAPKTIVRCIAKNGLEYLDKLSQEKRSYVATHIDLKESAYKRKFMASMHHGEPSKHLNMYASQLAWDATMAESIVNYKHANPNTKIVHIAGKFHTEGGLGTAAQIKQLDPNLQLIIITPVDTISQDKNDYQLQVIAPPERYKKQENQQAAIIKLSKSRQETPCLDQ